jgi:hypothetical protein
VEWGDFNASSYYTMGRLGTDATAYNSGAIYLYQNGFATTAVTISGNGNSYFNGGNVGIGTALPSHTLHVAGGSCRLQIDGTPSSNACINLNTNGNYSYIFTDTNGCLELYSNCATAAYKNVAIMNSNNLGIGTVSPAAPLTIQSAAISLYGSVRGHIVVQTDAATPITRMTLGYDTSYNYIQGWNSLPLCINPVGNNVGIGTTSPSATLHIYGPNSSGAQVLNCWGTYGATCQLFNVVNSANATSGNWSGQNAIAYVTKDTGTNRSINAAGTFNASGADYAEYMVKNGSFTLNKGDIVGIDSQGLLTNQYDLSVTFVVKSTNPSYVGGDVWGTEQIVGIKPVVPGESVSEEEQAAYQTALNTWNAALETERQKVDRIAFSGQVPVNVVGANPGDYIVPLRSSDGTISGQSVSNPSFEQYQLAVGKVITILADGRAHIVVKVA